VDTGWINDENVRLIAAPSRCRCGRKRRRGRRDRRLSPRLAQPRLPPPPLRPFAVPRLHRRPPHPPPAAPRPQPLNAAARTAARPNFQTPIDEIDAAARILDPIFSPLLAAQEGDGTAHAPYGAFLKDYFFTTF
jgi:hypothetical protein